MYDDHPEDFAEVEDPAEPQPEDYIFHAAGTLDSGVYCGIVEGGDLGRYGALETALKVARDRCYEEGYWPTFWWISDHGNAWPIDPVTGDEIR